MRILFDQGTPVPLRRHLAGHEIVTAHEQGWSTLKNGDLLSAAESGGFAVLVTTDLNLKYQQSLASRTIAIVVLGTTSWPRIQRCLEQVGNAVAMASPGSYLEVPIP